MKWTFLAFVVVLLASSVVSCTRFKLDEAQKGLEATQAQLPYPDNFTPVTSISGASYDKWDGESCYHAQALVALGTSLTREEALKTYVQELLNQGWTIQQGNYETSKTLVRGKNEGITVYVHAPGLLIESDEDYQQAQNDYPAFVYLVIDYFLPSRKVCMGE